MVLNAEDILLGGSFDIFCSVRILQGVVRVLEVLDRGSDIRNHYCLAIAT